MNFLIIGVAWKDEKNYSEVWDLETRHDSYGVIT